MDKHRSLKLLLDTHLDKGNPNSCQIYEEKMVRLWSGYVLLLAIARPLRLVSLTLDMRKTSSPINKNHGANPARQQTNVRGNIANARSPEARHLMLLTISFQGIFRNQKLFVLVTMSYLVIHEMPDKWVPSLVLLSPPRCWALSCPLSPQWVHNWLGVTLPLPARRIRSLQ